LRGIIIRRGWKLGRILRQEGKVTLLSRGDGCAIFRNGSNKGLSISEKSERTSLKEETDMMNRKVGR
jgi:hypothetical protein